MRRNRTDGIFWTGRLATPEEIRQSGAAKDVCFVNKWNMIQFMLKVTSRFPGELPNNAYVVCYSNKVASLGISNMEDAEETERLEHFKAQLERCLFGFTYEKNQSGYLVAKNIDMIPGEPGEFSGETFYQIPVVTAGEPTGPEGRAFATVEELKEALIRRESIGTFPRCGMGDERTIPYVLFYDPEQLTYTILGNFTACLYDAKKGVRFDYRQLKQIAFEEEWYDKVYSFSRCPQIAYVSERLQHDVILERLETSVPVDCSTPLSEDDFNGEPEIDPETIARKESAFLEQFYAICCNEGYYFNKKELINFHTAVKSNPCTILSGVNGCGKSKLISCYASALGLEKGQYRTIAVAPDWNNDKDLLGFVDYAQMVYRPAATGLLETLIEAGKEENRNKLYLIALEDSNLSRMEHYFYRFASALEENEEGVLELYAPEYECRLYNGVQYPARIPIRHNVRFVGTMEQGEATFRFSNMVYDRINLISLSVVPFTSWTTLEQSVRGVITEQWSYEDYRYMVKPLSSNPFSPRELEFLWKLHKILSETASYMGIGPRVIKQMGLYIHNLPSDDKPDFISKKEGLDLQLVQRIFTKLCGQQELLAGLLADGGNSPLYKLFDDYGDLSKFEHSRAFLEEKTREMKVYGFVM